MKLKTYGMKEATEAGISKLVRDAEEGGLVLLRRNGVSVAMMMSLTPAGKIALLKVLEQAMTEDAQKLRDNPNLAVFANLLQGLREGVGSAGEQPTSARQGGVKGRRRKEPK